MGCLTRQMETIAIEKYLELNGWIQGDIEAADLVVASTCAVTQEMVGRSLERIQILKKSLKKDALMVVTGCLVGIDKTKLSAIHDGPIVDPYSIHELDTILNSRVSFKSLPFSTQYKKISKGANTEPNAFVIRVNFGCGHTCSYCAIRKVYPKIKSTPIDQIIADIKRAVADGAPEIVFVSEDLTAYGKEMKTSFVALLTEVQKLNLKVKIALPRMHPDYLIENRDFFIQFIRNHNISVIGFILNSGSQKVLKLMNRDYDLEAAREMILEIKKISSHTVIRSDLIIGHPGEDEEDFRKSVKYFNELPFDIVAAAKFSLMKDTPAEKIEPKVPQEVIDRRAEEFERAYIFATSKFLDKISEHETNKNWSLA